MTYLETILADGVLSSAPSVSNLERLATETERTFLNAGSGLERASKEIAELRELFAKIESGLGVEAGAAFAGKVQVLSQSSASVKKSLEDFVDRTALLDRATQAVSTQIADLDRVVRTIATLAITARVIGHALSPPEAKVASFVENLSQMSSEAEGILSEVTSAMGQIRSEMQDLPNLVELVQHLLTRDVMVQLSGLTLAADELQHRRPKLIEAGKILEAEMSRVGREVARLIVALQIADSFRQRLGRVIVTFQSTTMLTSPEAICANHALAAGLLTAAKIDAANETNAATSSLFELEMATMKSVRLARETYLGRGHSGQLSNNIAAMARVLETKLQDVDEALSSLGGRTERVVAQVQQIFAQEKTLRQIAHKVRLAGLNAIVICTQLGSRANALREVAQWLRGMTDEADTATEKLQKALNDMRELIDAVGVESLKKLSDGTAAVVEGGRAMYDGIEQANALIATASERIGHIGISVPAKLRPAHRDLGAFVKDLATIDQDLRELAARQSILPAPAQPFAEGSAERAHFDALRKGYTMAAERELHDKILGYSASGQVATADKGASGAAPGDLDDILF